MPRLLLVNPVSDQERGLQRKRATRFPPLGLAYLAAVTPDHWKVKLLDENVGASPFSEGDLVGITSFTSTVNRSYEIASFYRKKKIPVIMGGIHATMMPDEALNYVDSVVLGEGEGVWPQILQEVEAGDLKKTYKAFPDELSNLPIPKRELFDSHYIWGTLQTSRGCPMNCHFCSVTAFNGRQFRQRPLEEVLEELQTIRQKNVFFVDDNLLGYGKAAEDRAIRLFRGIVEQKIRKRFFCQTSLNFANNKKVLIWARKAGFKMILVGLESISEGSLKYLGKNYNLKAGIEQYTKSIRKCHDHGIGVVGTLMFGSDEDDPDIFQRTLNFIKKSGLDVIQITFPTPLPGTRLFQEMRNEQRLTFTNFPEDWNIYRFSKVLYRPKKVSEEDLYRGMAFVKDSLYTSKPFSHRVLRTFAETRDIKTTFLSYKFNKAYRRGYLESDYFKSYSSMQGRSPGTRPCTDNDYPR